MILNDNIISNGPKVEHRYMTGILEQILVCYPMGYFVVGDVFR